MFFLKEALHIAIISFFTIIHAENTMADDLQREVFGTTSAGEPVYRYTLKNKKGITIKFLNYGGIVTEIETPDKNGKMANIILGFANFEDYAKYNNNIHFGALLGRFANRIAKGQFTIDGKQYQLAINDPPNTLHSGPDNFGIKIWSVKPEETKLGQGAELKYVSPSGSDGFPGTLTTIVHYSLDDDNNFRIVYTATTDATTIINLTNHSYFNLLGEGSGTVETHLIQINADNYLPTDKTSIPTGKISPVENTPYDLRKPTPIGKYLRSGDDQMVSADGYDKNFILNKKNKSQNSLDFAVRVYEPKSGRVLELSTTQPSVQFYSANGLNGKHVGSSGKTYRQTDAFALETQHYPDSPNHPSFPTTLLKPGETFREEAIFHFGIKN